MSQHNAGRWRCPSVNEQTLCGLLGQLSMHPGEGSVNPEKVWRLLGDLKDTCRKYENASVSVT